MERENVTILDHPLIQHKISMLRDERTGTNEFRKLVEEIATLMGFEALRDLPLEDAVIVDSTAVLSAGKTFACREHFCGISIYPPQKAMGIVTGLFAP